MLGFSKKKKEEPELEIDEVKPRKSRRSDSRGKEQKKESPKPWGKNERYTLLFILMITVIGSSLLAMIARSWKLPGLPRVRIPEGAFEETFVLEGDNPELEVLDETRSEKITADFQEITKKLSGIYGFAVLDLKTGARFGLHEDEIFQAASLIKLPAMTYLYEQAETKRINLESKHSLDESEKIGGSGSLYYEPAGTVITNRELIEYMGQYSDNTAFNIALNTLGREKFQNYISEIGMRDTSYESNMTSIRDITNFFKKLWEERLTTQEHRDEMISFLTNTSYEQHLVAGVPEEIQVAHKYGRELHVVNDAGIVFSQNPFIVVIMTKGIVETEADAIFPELSRLIYEGMVN